MTNPQLWQAARHAKLWAAGGLNATEMNGGRSEAEWNPVSIVGWICEKVCAFPLWLAFVFRSGCHALKQ